ncbi:thioredoxin family protein [uncultured Dokdonia sp.]|uniref:DUF1223 domain-containing protein n=1 Tax=uncultured Dokdonia sp. TaxID=575653 RepID=UPI002630B239|nr:DUF1223 domain-containing protein [uncultured Dokdonia sp.]
MIRTSLILILFFTLLLQTTVNAQKRPTVIELFTSQGCSSCPPADQLLEQIKKEFGNDVITLSYHVDYWDYIGWKDPFATRRFTQKQYTYAEKFRSRSVYTPQAVINGRTHHTGSDKAAIYRVLNAENKITNPIDLTITKTQKEGKTIAVTYALSEINTANELTFVIAIDEKITAVKRGENRNKTLKNTHIVVAEQTISTQTTNGQLLLQLPDWIQNSDQLSVIAYATKANVGIIDAVTKRL